MKLPKLKNPFKVIRELRKSIIFLREEVERLKQQNASLKLRAHFIDNNVPTEDAARACLMQLRVYGMTDGHGRTGFGVTAFIPEETLSAIKDKEMAVTFTRVVADELVRRALAGAHHVNSRGAVSALLFEPLVPGKPCGAIGNVFDTPRGPAIALGRKPGDSYSEHLRKQQEAELALQSRQIEPRLLPREAESEL